MKFLAPLAFAATLAAPAVAAAQPAMSINVNCGSGAPPPVSEAPILHGNWDFLMDVGGEPSFGLMSIGFNGNVYGGSVTPVSTAPVTVRQITMTGNNVRMEVASPDGDILFNGTLSSKGDRLCGTVTYHGGRTFSMVAQKRPTTYRWQPRAQRTR